jgi:hypothetical protein
MPHRHFAAPAVPSFVLLSLLTGCYASHAYVSAEAWEDAMLRALCETADECPNASGVPGGFGEPVVYTRGDVALCMDRLRERSSLRAWRLALEHGDAELDPAAIPGCIEAIHDATCGYSRRLHPSAIVGFSSAPPYGSGSAGRLGFDERCDAMFVPTGPAVPDAGPCDGPLDCEEGAFCTGDGEDLHCERWPEPGAECDTTDPCRGPSRMCIDGRCEIGVRRRAAAVGAPCALLRGADGGAIDERCAPGLACTAFVLGDPSAPHCVATASEGEGCGLDGPCAGPLLCVDIGMSLPGTFRGICASLVRATEAGAICAGEPRTSPPTTCDPRAGLVCSSVDETPGVCIAE